MRALALALLLGCSMSKSAERQDSFGQEVESRRDEGAVRVVETVEEFGSGGSSDARSAAVDASPADGLHERRLGKPGDAGVVASPPFIDVKDHGCGPGCFQWIDEPPRLIRRTVTVTDRAPVTTSTKTQTDASGEAHTASAQRFGFSPWQWAIGAAVLAALAYGAFWVKRKLAL